ncbi:MAG: hypothetical protein WC707_06280 [Candidatus Babeliaceae bacterium]|jgi:hypothetical protein
MNLDLRHKDLLRGLLYIVGGVALLLHTFGYIQKGINAVLIILSITIIGYGIAKSGVYGIVRNLISKK